MKMLLNKIIHFITLQLIAYCEGRGKVFFIKGKGEDNSVYLIRYLLIQNKYFNFYIHRFLRSDADDPHNHPWNFITYVVDGEYTEHKYDLVAGSWTRGKGCSNDYRLVINKRTKGSLVSRRRYDVHKVLVKENIPVLEKERAPLTICITGPRLGSWGFWKGEDDGGDLVNADWIEWTKYLGIEDDSSKRG